MWICDRAQRGLGYDQCHQSEHDTLLYMLCQSGPDHACNLERDRRFAVTAPRLMSLASKCASKCASI